jgi:5-methyltetrahydrofolate--homocysteine methyltransferase
MSDFLKWLNSGKNLVADGATGTNLQARGLPRGMTGEMWVKNQPDQIIKLHQDFIEAGAQIILTSTFNASPLRLEETELAGLTMEINHRAVSLARQAVDGKAVLVGGSMGPTGKLLKPYGPLSEQEAIDSFAEQARALDQAGVDLIAVETQFDISEATMAVIGIRSVTNKPLVVTFSFDRGTRSMMGASPSQVADELGKMDVNVLGINCGRSLSDNLTALKELRSNTQLPIWFKPNAGLPQIDSQGNTYYNVTPQEMSNRVPEWLSAGAQIIGGCCGTTPDHLRAIAMAAHA